MTRNTVVLNVLEPPIHNLWSMFRTLLDVFNNIQPGRSNFVVQWVFVPSQSTPESGYKEVFLKFIAQAYNCLHYYFYFQNFTFQKWNVILKNISRKKIYTLSKVQWMFTYSYYSSLGIYAVWLQGLCCLVCAWLFPSTATCIIDQWIMQFTNLVVPSVVIINIC